MPEIPEEAIGQVASIVYYWDSDGPDKPEDWNGYLKDAEAYIAAYTAYLESKGAEILYPGEQPSWNKPVIWCEDCEDFLPSPNHEDGHTPDKPVYRNTAKAGDKP